ncbi:MAG: caspase family protein [Myxococcota bacterium]
MSLPAALVRLAVVISANEGLTTDVPLRYADDDGDRVADVLRALGDVSSEHLFRVPEADVDAVTDALGEAVLRASALRREGRTTELVVYYTGHASSRGLHLAGDVLPIPSLKTAARVVPADRRVFIVDACQAGTMLRSKGATLVAVSDAPALPGESPAYDPPADEAWIASTGAEELAFEVEQRRGALFTHFFVSGARGAADDNRDGQVTLHELYGFVQRQTERTAAGLGVVQRPRWAGSLGELVLANLVDAPSGLSVTGPVEKPVLVIDVDAKAVAAEVPAGAGRTLALDPGRYQLVRLERGRRAAMTEVVVPNKGYAIISARRLYAHPGVRTKGGLLDPKPTRFAVGPSGGLGFAPGRPDGFGAFASLRRSTGRGHRLALGVEGGQMGLGITRAVGTDTWGLVHGEWGLDVRGHRVRTGPTLDFGAGFLRQTAARAADPDWGRWYGDQTAARTVTVPLGRGLLGWTAEWSLTGPVGLLAFAGGGLTVYGTRNPVVQPAAQVRAGLSFQRGDR